MTTHQVNQRCVSCGKTEDEHITVKSHKFDSNVFPVTWPDTEAGKEWINDDFRGNPGKWTTFLTAEGLSQRIQKVETEARDKTLDEVQKRLTSAFMKKPHQGFIYQIIESMRK